jgi:23S rRNA (cytidine1920-2'-O)/16S rRNA (cytidine1409-2'-O)-methyltransferase
MPSQRTRLDVLLVQRELAPSRERARALIMAGKVLVDDRPADKPGARIPDAAEVRLRVPDHPYVSRGGVKLEGALSDLAVDPTGLSCLDVGASTGGFTDCLLRHGAVSVLAVDVGTNQLAWSLRTDERVTSLEKTDIRHLAEAARGGETEYLESADLAVVDASFISLRLVLPATVDLVRPGGSILALVKPQFEVGKSRVGKGGVVKDEGLRRESIEGIGVFAEGLGLKLEGSEDCQLPGARKGNVEHFLLFRRG